MVHIKLFEMSKQTNEQKTNKQKQRHINKKNQNKTNKHTNIQSPKNKNRDIEGIGVSEWVVKLSYIFLATRQIIR